MENLPFKIDNNDYVKLLRSLKTAYLDGLLKFEDYTVLVWLWITANPRNGKTHASYAGLITDYDFSRVKVKIKEQFELLQDELYAQDKKLNMRIDEL